MNILSLNAVSPKYVIIFLLITRVFLYPLNLPASSAHYKAHSLFLLIDDFRGQSEVILLTLAIDSIELSDSAVRSNNLTVAEEPPDLSQSHREGFFTFLGLDFTRIDFVPVLQV